MTQFRLVFSSVPRLRRGFYQLSGLQDPLAEEVVASEVAAGAGDSVKGGPQRPAEAPGRDLLPPHQDPELSYRYVCYQGARLGLPEAPTASRAPPAPEAKKPGTRFLI